MELIQPVPVLSATRGRAMRVTTLGSHTSELMGAREFQPAQLSMKSKSHMGPARHALSQMVVAGVMHHQPAIVIKVNPNEYGPKDSGLTR